MFVCTYCGEELKSPLFCGVCEKLLKEAKNLDYFALFGLEKGADINRKELTKKYRALSRQAHPDFHGADKALAEDLSGFLNTAYQTLSDRGSYLEYHLNLAGGKTAAEDKRTDQSFLMEMMEFQERVELESSENERDSLKKELSNLENIKYIKANQHLGEGDLDKTRLALNEASYCRRLLKNLGELV